VPERDVVLSAPAKLTLSLEVTGIRADGYHELRAEMVSVDLSDTLELEPGDGLQVVDAVRWFGPPTADESGAAEVAAPDGGVNLVTRALELAGRTALVRLTKRIPAGAGLGGGSSDAAAILRWAGVSSPEAALRLGADVPFCLVGGRARVSGVGELVEPLPPRPGHFLLVAPRLHVSTPAVYAAWDELGGPEGDHGNDLEPAALAVAPELRWWRDVLGAATGRRPRLAGSGGTWFVSGEADHLLTLADRLRGEIVAGHESALVEVVRTV
jgi:4-diphosphocytidyl-2-C-methyl-D-erythritol kinase